MHLVISVKYGEADNTLYKLIYIALKIVLLVACMHNTAGSSLLWQWSAGFINLFKLLRVRHENQLLNPNLFCTSSNISIIRPSLLKKNAAAYLTLLSTWILSMGCVLTSLWTLLTLFTYSQYRNARQNLSNVLQCIRVEGWPWIASFGQPTYKE